MSKIVLVQPPDPSGTQILRDHMGKFGIVQQSLSRLQYDLLPPLDLAYSAALLEKKGHEISIIDSPALGLDSSRVLHRIINENPDLIVISTSGVSVDEDLGFAEIIKKETDKLVAVSGLYISLFPEFALRRGVDLVIRDEIEYTTLTLSQNLSNFDDIKGLFYMKNGSIVQTPKRSIIKNLDELPFPSYHLLPMENYRYHLLKKPFTTVLSSRGCPFGCIYCPYPLGYGDIWRGRSPENVLAELKLLVEKFNIKSVLFRDQVFTYDMKRAEKICDGIIQEGLDIEWRCETRVDRLSKNLMNKMKEAGCNGIHLGVESGDPKILKSVAKLGLTIDSIKKVFRDAKEVGLETVAFFMIGLPGETKESISKTFKLAKELKSDITWFTAAAPVPGTKLYELAEKKGWILTKDWKKYSGREVVMRTDNLTEHEIKNALNDAKIMFSSSGMSLIKKGFSRKGISLALSNPKKVMKYVFSKFKS